MTSRKTAGLSTSSIIILAIIIIGALVYTGNLKIPAGFPGSTAGNVISNPGAQCAFTGQSTPPVGCSQMQVVVQINPVDVSSGTAIAASTYSIQPWTFLSGTWQATPAAVKCGAAPTSCTLAALNPGTQLVVQLCSNQTPSCSSSDYGQQKEQIACPLPSLTAPTNQACSLAIGPGAGYVPWAPGNPSTAPTVAINMPVVLYAGTAQASNTPVMTTWTAQNATSYQTAWSCYVSTGSKNCGLPKATAQGRFTLPISFQVNGAGTNPANPASIGFASYNDPRLASITAYGGAKMQQVLSVEVKQTAGSGMCKITGSTLPGSLTVLPNSNSATDIFYYWVLPDSALTLITDSNGNPQTIAGTTFTGLVTATMSFDCNSVYNNAGTTVTITPLIYSFFDLAYTQAYNGASLNSEKQTASESAVLSVIT